MDAGYIDRTAAHERDHAARDDARPDVDVLVLNYNGRALLAECLPSIVRAAAESSRVCRVTVVDNASSDDPTDWLATEFPNVALRRLPNDGLASFNVVARELTSRVLVLLNNDIKLAPDAIDPLVAPLLDDAYGSDYPADEPVFMTAPRCTLFDGVTHEGFKTSVVMRRGLVQATALFTGAEQVAGVAGPTASAGAALAVDRRTFLALGGFDPLYLPGRIEDLDFAYRGFLAGYRALYVPESHTQHKGSASFGPTFGASGNDHLALRNTLLFQWKNLRAARHRVSHLAWLPVRAARDLVGAWKVAPSERFPFLRAYAAALTVWNERSGNVRFEPASDDFARSRELEFFARHAPSRLLAPNDSSQLNERERSLVAAEACRAVNYPLARWYSRPAAASFAKAIADTRIRPWHLTLVGFACACAAAACVLSSPRYGVAAAGLMLAAWFFDRADGLLARRQNRATPLGAWLDANVDETVDLGLHVCMAASAAAASASNVAWIFLIAFLVGKYLLMYGLAAGETMLDAEDSIDGEATADIRPTSLLKRLYHLPGNADIRIHLTALALATGLLTTELAIVACYYNLRWLARIVLQVRRALARPTLRRLA
jgi:N-acetylglucosaminyl-diphospho-decaprenol L-rhamnosyltransferase